MLMAQGPITRGRLLESDSGDSGELSIRTTANRVYWFVYDTKTYVEQDNQLSAVPKLRKGDEIEIVSDKGPDAALRYARTIHVVDSVAEKAAAQKQFSQGRYALPRRTTVRDDPEAWDLFLPHGSLTFAGLVCQLNAERLVLRLRTGVEKTIYLRPDTRYMKDGGLTASSSLHLNTRVYVRGSQNLDGEVEAYQIIWGELAESGLDR